MLFFHMRQSSFEEQRSFFLYSIPSDLMIRRPPRSILFSMPFESFFKVIPDVIFSYETIQLGGAMILVLIFNALWKESGQLNLVINKIEHVFQDSRITMAMLPAIMGLMPIMGGAYLSAPLVDQSSAKLNLKNEHKAFINFWFRHLWEYCLPTYPGVLLSASILGCGISTVVFYNSF